MNSSKTVIFFGNEHLATGIKTNFFVRQALDDSGYVVHSAGKDLNNQTEKLRSLKPDIGVLVAYGTIVPKEIMDLFPHGIINIHPSLLPKGRGPAPIEETILDGSRLTGVSIMKLSEKMDEGPLLAQREVRLRGDETKQELADSLLELGGKLLISCLDDIFSGSANEIPQSDEGVTYTHKIKKSDGVIDWNKPAEHIERELRAFAGWPKSRTQLNGLDCIILDAEIISEKGLPGNYRFDNKSLAVYAGEGALVIRRIQPAGKKAMSIEEFLRGYSSRL